MNKRIIALLLCSLMLTASFFGCSKTSQTDNNADSNQSDVKNSASVTASAEISGGAIQTVSYNYEQDLNILKDNYRNYYEIFVYSFCDSNSDGIGDLNGVISKLDYVKDMGFNGIWLMPVMPSTTYHKYDVTDYYSIDSQYGTLDDFKKLVEECNKRGIKLIIDFVFNHTSAKHPWFTQAVDYLETLGDNEEPDLKKCPYVGYYHFTKESSGNAYYRAGNSDYYYEAMFWDQMPDLALESPEVRKEIEKAAKFWLDLDIGGFRLDAAKEYFSGDTSKNVEVLTWFTDYVKSVKKDAYVVGEVFDNASTIASYYKSGIPSLFDFPMAQYNGIIASPIRKLGTYNAKSFASAWMKLIKDYSANNSKYIDAPFLSNHDTTRVSAQYANNEDQMKMGAGVLMTMNGSPFVYYGEEIGMNSQGNKDENKRLPMQWSASDTTGMTTAPANADQVVQKFAPLDEQQKDPLSMVNYYKRAIRIRNENPEIARGKVSLIEQLTDKNTCAVKKTYQDSTIVIVYNISKDAAKVDLKKAGVDQLKIRGYMTVDGSAVNLKNGVLQMPLYSIVILK